MSGIGYIPDIFMLLIIFAYTIQRITGRRMLGMAIQKKLY